MPNPLSPEVKLGRENERLKIQNGELRARIRKYERREGGFMIDETVEQLREILKTEDQRKFILKPTQYSKPKPKGVVPFNPSHYEYVAKAWSDWHLSENIRKQDTNGVNEYNSIICANRVWEDVDKTKRIITGHKALYDIKKFWLMALGDMINGSIHEELRYTNDLFDPSAAVLAARLMQMGIEEFKTLGLPIEVDCLVGNHPRTTAKMPAKRQAHQSLDYVVYEMVANYFAKDDQVKINVHTGQIESKEVLGHRYILEHGIDVQSGKEEDLENRLRGVYDDATYRKATGLKGTSFDQIVIGNMHRPKWLERVIVNGSLTGQNELGISWRLKTIKAQQFMWGITEEHVRSWQYAIDVTHVTSKKADNPFSEYATWFMKRNGR